MGYHCDDAFRAIQRREDTGSMEQIPYHLKLYTTFNPTAIMIIYRLYQLQLIRTEEHSAECEAQESRLRSSLHDSAHPTPCQSAGLRETATNIMKRSQHSNIRVSS